MHQGRSRQIIGANDTVRPLGTQEFSQRRRMIAIQFQLQSRRTLQVGRPQRLPVPTMPRIDSWSGARTGRKDNPSAPCIHQVPRHPVPRARVIDSNQVIATAIRIPVNTAVHQHNRNARRRQLSGDPQIHLILIRTMLHRRKEHPRYPALNQVTAKLLRLLLLIL
ncbi:MAG: hypothetical protein QOJ99_2549 [Bryobacterales bacterium]|nr:hypothetical protein [Bryobacterales bacterium]